MTNRISIYIALIALTFLGGRTQAQTVLDRSEQVGMHRASAGWNELLVNGDCEGTDISCFSSRENGGDVKSAQIVNSKGYGGSKCIRLQNDGNSSESWYTQFFIQTPNYVWKPGQRFYLSFKARADKPAQITSEAHATPGDYRYWGTFGDYWVTTEWQKFEYEGTIPDDASDVQTITLDLNNLQEANNYYFDDISLSIPSPYTDKTFVVNKIQYHTTSGSTVEVIGHSITATPHQVGLATWDTQASYDDVKVTVNGKTIINDDFSGNNGWTSYGGSWSVTGGVKKQTAGGNNSDKGCRNICQTKFDGSTYTLTLRARKDGGTEGFLIIFDYQDEDNYAWWNIGGWSNTRNAIEICRGGSKKQYSLVNYAVSTGDWTDLKVEVDGDVIRCYINGQRYHELTLDSESAVSTLTIPSQVEEGGTTYTVTSIGQQALGGCGGVTKIVIPNTIKSIGYQAFIYNDITTFNFPASVTSIEDQLFQGCSKLATITVDGNNPNFCSVDGVMFSKNMKELWRYPQGKTEISYTIPSTVETLRTSAFTDSKLQSVTLPESIKEVFWYPFENCPNLTTVCCLRTEPFTDEYETFFSEDILKRATLYVPWGRISIYYNKNPWKNFSAIKEMPSEMTVTAKSYTIEYGDNLPSFSYTATVGPMVGQPKITCNATKSSSAGTYDIVIEQGTLSSPSKLKFVNGKLTIKKAPLTVSVGNYTRKQGEPNPTFKLNYQGFKNNQTENSLTKKPTASCNATTSSAPGTYTITVSGGSSANYDFTYRNGTLTVTKADAIVVTAKSYTITYGEAIPTLEYTTSGGTLEGKPTLKCSAGAAGTKPNAGVYDITVEKGTVSSYNVSYVKGTLTVNKAQLTAKVGTYVKYEGEDMPTFNVTYSGFKNGDTKNKLTQQPTPQCEANKWSPAGTYLISLSGGQSPNYDFTYQNGSLTVKHIYTMTLSTLGGHGSISYDGTDVRDYRKFDIKEGNAITLTFKPDNGYHLSQATFNGRDITSSVNNNRYTVTPAEDFVITATFDADQGDFTEGGITFSIISAPDKTVAIAKSNYSGSAAYQIVKSGKLTIPPSITHNNDTWHVVGIADNAFINCTWLKTLIVPASIRQANVGIALFTGCTNLSEIYWYTNFNMTNEMLGGFNNPNLLFYSTKKSHAPSNVQNEIIDGLAKKITLSDVSGDGYGNFYCTTTFTATSISYSHNYTMESAYGGTGGWETLALPFAVQHITHERAGEIVPFAAYNGTAAQHPFWLYTYGSSGFVKARSIEANVPYIICMPNNGEYDAEYQLPGRVTFSATNASVVASTGTAQKERPSRGGKTFQAAYKAQRGQTSGMYAMNVINDLYSATGGYRAGSIFINNLRSVSSFEAVMTTSNASVRTIDLEFNETSTGIDLLPVVYGGKYRVYNINGQLLIQTDNAIEFEQQTKQLPAGVYIINGKKKVIK